MNGGAMNSGFLPQLLMGITIVLLLALSARRTAIMGSLAFVAAYGVMLLVPFPPSWAETLVVGLWISVVATAALVYFPPETCGRLVLPLSINAGLWAGACTALAGPSALMVVGILPLFALAAARWVAARDFAIVLKVIASWMIAIASLSTFVSLLSTPGYEPDHMQ